MIIDVNTEELREAVQIARQANAAISETESILNSIVIHNDWYCPERTAINNNTTRNRTQIMQMQADAESLYKNVLYVSDQFAALEQEIAKSFDQVDGPLAKFLSQVPEGTGNTKNSQPSLHDIIGTGGAPGGLVEGAISKVKDFIEELKNVDPRLLATDGGAQIISGKLKGRHD